MKYGLLTAAFACGVSLCVSARVFVVNNRAPGADDAGEGTDERPLRTINAAAAQARAGDTVRVRAGVYRERVLPEASGKADAPIVYEAVKGERVVVKGSEFWTNGWTAVEGMDGVFRSPIDTGFFGKIPNPYAVQLYVSPGAHGIEPARPVPEDQLDKPWKRTLGQIFVAGEPLTQVQSMEMLRRMPNSWIVSADGRDVCVHLPKGHADCGELLGGIEWSVRNRIFCPYRRGLEHIHVKGFTFLHCANQGPFPQGGAVSPRTGKFWLFEGNTIRFAKTIGLDIGSESFDPAKLEETRAGDKRYFMQASHIVRFNTISDNGLCGIAGWASSDCRIYNNILERNNRLSLSSADCKWEEWAAIKLHGSNAVVANNLIRSNEGHGIWIDNGYNLARVTGNVLIDNAMSGVMMELGAGTVLIDNNIIACTRPVGSFYDGNGIYAHDASGLTVVHNLLFANGGAGVLMRTVSGRKYGGKPAETSDTVIRNNVFYGNEKGAICMPYPNERARNNSSDWNLFIGNTFFRINKTQDAFSWENLSQQLKIENQTADFFQKLSIEDWRKLMGWEQNSRFEPKGYVWSLLPYRMILRASVPKSLTTMNCPAIDEMTVDFAGTPMDSDQFMDDLGKMTVRPGPLQLLSPGTTEIPAYPFSPEEPPALRKSLETRKVQASETAFERKLKQMPKTGAAACSYTLRTPGVWFHAVQADFNPPVTAPFAQMEPGSGGQLSAQCGKGVSSGPADCLLFKVPEDGVYSVKVAGKVIRRTAATAGHAKVTLFQADPENGGTKMLASADLNTPDGYRGNELSDRFEHSGTYPAVKGSCIVLRFQIKAPGPAGAGTGVFETERFDISIP